MKISILAAGTRGDVQPFIALGLALKKTGAQVQLVTFQNYESLVRSYGLELFPIQGNVVEAATGETGREARASDNPLKMLLSFRALQKPIFDIQKDFYEGCLGADLLIYHPGCSIAYFAAKELGIPSIMATPFPMTPTRDYPSLVFYNAPRFGRTANYLTHKAFEQVMWSTAAAPMKKFWKDKFGRLPEGFGSPFSRLGTNGNPVLVSGSNHVFPRPADWPEQVYCNGYWFLDEEAGWQPPEELLAFLEAGGPPVYAGFGSIGDPQTAEKNTQLVIDALRMAGQRGILATGWGGMAGKGRVTEDMFMLESAPHAWLFPRMVAVVHHGGAGTTAAAFRAGISQVVVPHGLDQFAWGKRARELGVASKPLPQKDLSVERLAAAIQEAVNGQYAKIAEELGKKIRSEGGAEVAAEFVMKRMG